MTSRRRQRGAATLIVVMVLFFVISLAAAYTSRNLIFEQRTSANQYRSTQSFEAAEAGVEWALAMLNSGRIDANCQPTTDTTKDNFRQRYLDFNAAGIVTRKLADDVWAACTFTGTNWQCSCSTGVLAAASLPVTGVAFAVRFVGVSFTLPGVVRIEVNGCNVYDVACVAPAIPPFAGTCVSTLCSLLAVHSGAKSPPYAAVTARGSVLGTLTASNLDRPSGGITLHAGVSANAASFTLSSVPGTPGALSVRAPDALLSGLPADFSDCQWCTFAAVFGLRPDTYREQPATVQVDCSATCNAAAVNTALGADRGRIVWLRNAGGLTLNSAADIIGTMADPVVLVIDGPLTIAAPATTAAKIYGLVYAASANVAAGEIRGALVSASDVTGSGSAQITYDADALTHLRLTSGSFVRIAGGWRDFP